MENRNISTPYNKGYEKAVAEEGTTNPDPIQIDNYAFEDGIINMT
jgi:hypothetical protein